LPNYTCDHPENAGHPVKRRVDGQRGINPEPCIAGAIKLAAGAVMRHRYRMVLYRGTLDAEAIRREWVVLSSL